jgi:hypothetical protein
MCPLDVNTLQAGPTTVVVAPARAGSVANSPTPIVTSTGELVGLSHHDVLASDNDHYFSFDLDPATPSVLFLDTPTWINNGGYAGGVFYDAESTPAPYHIFDVETVWWTGGRAAIGTNLEVTVNAPGRMSGVPAISFFVVSRGFLASPVAIAGVIGPLGIDPSLLILFPVGAHTLATGRARNVVSLPNDPSLKGLVLPAQSLTIFLTPQTQIALGNTAALAIDP